MTLRERTALILLTVGGVGLVGAGVAFGWLFGGPLAAVGAGAVVLGGLAVTGGVLLGLGDDAPPAERTWLDPLNEWALDPELSELDFGGLPLPEKMAALLEQLR